MIDEEKCGAAFVAQLYDVRTKRDGGGRVSLDFGKDALEAVQFIQKLASMGDCNFEIAIVALPKQEWTPNDSGAFAEPGSSSHEASDF